jgi:hypothetical protein
MTVDTERPETGDVGTGQGGARRYPVKGDRLWPILLAAGLLFVILVNALFIYIAVSGADDVVPSYHTEER